MDKRGVQRALGVRVDGAFGMLSYKALLTFAAYGREPKDVSKMALLCATMFSKYAIDASIDRLGQFLATTSHETGNYTAFAEDLYYTTPARVVKNWPSRFNLLTATAVLRNPRKLAEKVYGYEGRHGTKYDLGNREGTSDAYDMRGGGWIQTTGYSNYLAAQKVTGLPLVDNPELLHDPLSSIEPACAYWRGVGCNELADADWSGRRARIKVNGGVIGLDDVQVRLKRLLVLLSSKEK